MQSKEASQRIKKLYNHANIPEDYWYVGPSQIKDEMEYKSKLMDYYDNIRDRVQNGDSVFFYGPLGTGKSACACMLLKKALANGIMGFYTPTFMLQEYSIKETKFDKTITMMERCKTVPLLVIDELQLKKNKKWVYEILDDLIRYRIGHKLATIICSNYDAEELREFQVKNDHGDLENPLEGFTDVCKQTFEVIKVKGQRFRK